MKYEIQNKKERKSTIDYMPMLITPLVRFVVAVLYPMCNKLNQMESYIGLANK